MRLSTLTRNVFASRSVTEERSKVPPGPLFGLPVTVKGSISVAGHRCEIGSLINRGNIPTEDATVVSRLRNAGATILGTTNSPEFLMAYETDNRLYGRTNNPWNLDYSPGGSSGGESAAIAAGLSCGGLGSDSGGSVRVPAHFTGICSLKPTPGRIPGSGHLPACVGPFSILGAIGPMARTMDDVTLLFQVLSGQDPIDPRQPSYPTTSDIACRCAATSGRVFRRRRLGPRYARDEASGTSGGTSASKARLRCATVSAQRAGASAKTLVDVLCPLRRYVCGLAG